MAAAQAKQLANKLGARPDLCELGAICMDIKLGEAFSQNKLAEHVVRSLDYTEQIMADMDIPQADREIILNAIAAHHGAIPHNSLESEIVTNADCYRFLHPLGIFEYLKILSRRDASATTLQILKQVQVKMDEKWALVTLPIVRAELEPYYQQYRQHFLTAATDF